MVVEETGTATFECVVTGKPTPTVKWYKGKEEIKPSVERKISFNPETGIATLQLLKPTPEDEVIFKVKADNKFGKAECRANLVMSKGVIVTQPVPMQAPIITRPIDAVASKAGEAVTLEAEFEGSEPFEVEWYRNGAKVVPNEHFKINVDKTKSTLKITKTTKSTTGKYEIKVVNPKGEARSSGTVTITKETEGTSPRFIQPLKPQHVAVGEVVILEAVVEAFPIASFQWFQHSVPIQQSHEFKIVTKENRSILLINEVKPQYTGLFTCRAENAIGSVTSTATINVLEEVELEETTELEYPRFVKPLSPTRVMDGQTVTFTCVVVGKPIPKVQWFHNDVPIKEAKDITISQDTEGVCSLAILEAFPENAGEYTCIAENKVGEAVCKSTLIVEGNVIFINRHTSNHIIMFLAYEYLPDSELGIMTGPSGSEEDLLADKVCTRFLTSKNYLKTLTNDGNSK